MPPPISVWLAFKRWRRNRRAVEALQELDARLLKDIGIDRSEIESVVCGRDASRTARS